MVMPIRARSNLLKLVPSGRNRGSITEAMNSTEMSGTPRHSSMKTTHMVRMTGISERRPSASNMPMGSAATMPT